MAFTTWAAEKTKLEEAISSRNWHVKSYSIGGRSITYNSEAEVRLAYEWVSLMAAKEAGSYYPRTYAKPGSGGRW